MIQLNAITRAKDVLQPKNKVNINDLILGIGVHLGLWVNITKYFIQNILLVKCSIV